MRKLAVIALLLATALPAGAAPVHHQAARPDGSTIDYTLDLPEAAPRGLLLLAQGSGCAPAATNASLATVRAAFPGYAALTVEKIGVTADAGIVDGFADCPPAFHAGYTVTQRLADYRAVLAAVTANPAIPDRLVLFGGSEGGLAVAMLAAEFAPAATVILSSATGTSFADMVLSTVPPEGHATIEAGFAAARANPHSDERFAGSTYRFWADILDHRSLDYMERSTGPLLLIQGGRDRSSPLAAARATADAFVASGRCNLTYWELPALDHGMATPAGASRLAAVAALAAHWVEAPLAAC